MTLVQFDKAIFCDKIAFVMNFIKAIRAKEMKGN